MKYEEPLMEIIKFEFKNNVLTASVPAGGGGGGTENKDGENKDPIGSFDGSEIDPFA